MGHQSSTQSLSLQNLASSSLVSILLGSCLVGVFLCPKGLRAEELPNDLPNVGDGTVQVTFVPPNGDAPRETRGGAARDSSCLEAEDTDLSLTALVPQSNYGLTTQSHPVFLVYAPSVPTGSVFFNLRDEQGQSVYETFLPIQNTSGVVTIAMPKDAPPLEVGKAYEWGVAVPCSARLRPDSPFVSSWVRRIEEEEALGNELNPSLEYASQYGQEGIWYDMLALLAELREFAPDSDTVNHNWFNILQSANLAEVDS